MQSSALSHDPPSEDKPLDLASQRKAGRVAALVALEWAPGLLFFFCDIIFWVAIYGLLTHLRHDAFFSSGFEFFIIDLHDSGTYCRVNHVSLLQEMPCQFMDRTPAIQVHREERIVFNEAFFFLRCIDDTSRIMLLKIDVSPCVVNVTVGIQQVLDLEAVGL